MPRGLTETEAPSIPLGEGAGDDGSVGSMAELCAESFELTSPTVEAGRSPAPKRHRRAAGLAPKKADFRQRAHCNPLSDFGDVHPTSPDHVDWSLHYPHVFAGRGGCGNLGALRLNTKDYPAEYAEKAVSPELNGRNGPLVRYLDVGCGFGGLLMHLAALHVDKLIMGMEIREQVTNYVGIRVRARREAEPNLFHNVSVVRTNAMKFLPNYFRKSQLEKIFFCFPDPQFKKKHERRRIVSTGLLPLYAYLLQEGGRLYFCTDVKEVYDSMTSCCDGMPLFVRVSDAETAEDECVAAMISETEEAKKVKNLGRFGHEIFFAVYQRTRSVSCEDVSHLRCCQHRTFSGDSERRKGLGCGAANFLAT